MSLGFFMLHELRLRDDPAATARVAAQLAGLRLGRGDRVLPLLVSIDDRRDVAYVVFMQVLPTDRGETRRRITEALGADLASSDAARFYGERAALGGGDGLGAYYRMAVTESGANEAHLAARPGAPSSPPLAVTSRDAPVELLWIGMPLAGATGMLLVTGHHDAKAYEDARPGDWPLPLSRELGVRIYESAHPLAA